MMARTMLTCGMLVGFWLTGCWLDGGWVRAAEEPAATPDADYFKQHVQPLLVRHCLKCHGDEKQESGLRLDSWEGISAGGDSGPAVVPGEPQQSLLLTAIRYVEDDLQMPPDRKLPDDQIAMVRKWIEAGAPHPDARGKSPANRPSAPIPDLEEARKFWSFRPPQQPEFPAISDTRWPSNGIDYFVLAQLERAGLQPAAAAERRDWLRRVTFDLIGLPPTPEDIQAFLADATPDAFARVVDRLLASPHYGERWGRHWLDVARYADSNGLDENIAHGNAWRYRDYVIAAFNKDKPYDEFLSEQLAGDRLPYTSEAEHHEQLTATGFLSLGPKVLAEVDETKMEMDIIDEQINTLGRALLGLTIGCARCHDHKFDPISMRDYYALAGIFKSTRTMEHFRKIARWNENSVASSQQQAGADEHARQVSAKEQVIKQVVDAANQKLVEQAGGAASVPKNAEQQYPAETREELQRLREELKQLQAETPQLPTAMGVCDREISDVPLHVRGSHLTLGEVVPRGFPKVLVDDGEPSVAEQSSGREELARWLTSEDHPLTSRVMVNRLWRWHFGQGICRSTDNFGRLGTGPSNPELLDWLAIRFQRDGWSIKAFHRLVLLSSTYRMSSSHDARAAEKDPDNHLLWHFPIRRLEAESVRDALLFVSGGLDRRMGGSLLHVENREFLFNHTSQDGTKYDSPRRSVYLPVVRNNLYDVFQLFDYADASVSNGDRNSTTIAPQALIMMNSDLVLEASRAIGDGLRQRQGWDDRQRVEHLYLTVYGRPPSDEERTRFMLHLDQLTEAESDTGRGEAWQAMCHVLLASNEFIYLR
jgi:hypothetical protein